MFTKKIRAHRAAWAWCCSTRSRATHFAIMDGQIAKNASDIASTTKAGENNKTKQKTTAQYWPTSCSCSLLSLASSVSSSSSGSLEPTAASRFSTRSWYRSELIDDFFLYMRLITLDFKLFISSWMTRFLHWASSSFNLRSWISSSLGLALEAE